MYTIYHSKNGLCSILCISAMLYLCSVELATGFETHREFINLGKVYKPWISSNLDQST